MGYRIRTLLEKTSLLSKWEQRKTISTALFEATVSSAWTVISPRFLIKPPCPLLFWSLNDKLLLGLVAIWRTHSSHQRHSVATISILNPTVLISSTMKMIWIQWYWPLIKCNWSFQGILDLPVLASAGTRDEKISWFSNINFISRHYHSLIYLARESKNNKFVKYYYNAKWMLIIEIYHKLRSLITQVDIKLKRALKRIYFQI